MYLMVLWQTLLCFAITDLMQSVMSILGAPYNLSQALHYMLYFSPDMNVTKMTVMHAGKALKIIGTYRK